MVPWLAPDDPFPPVERALGATSGAPGLLAASADLLPSRLIDAYRRGIFPWYSDGQPVLWWSPDPRMILRTGEFKVSPSLKKTLRRVLRDDAWEIRVDHDFASVMRACATLGQIAGAFAAPTGPSFEWDEPAQTLVIADPYLQFYLRWSIVLEREADALA